MKYLLACGILAAAAVAEAAPPLRILPLGDSVTMGFSMPTSNGGYRKGLYSSLTTDGFTVDYVGTQVDTPVSGLPDLDHEGHGGFKIADIDSGLAGYLDAVPNPDAILLLIGTNDFSPPQSDPTNARFRLQTLLSHLVALRPSARIFVADVPQRIDNSASDTALQTYYNPYIPGIVDDMVAAGAHISFVALRSQLTTADLSPDGLHPNQSGYNKIAAAWTSAIEAAVTPEGTAVTPTILRASAEVDLRHVAITFSKPVEDAATTLSHFGISGGVSLVQASLDAATKRTLTLTTSAQAPGTSYTLTVTGVRDRTAQHLTIDAGTAVTFQSGAVTEAANYTRVYSLDLPAFANYRTQPVAYSDDAHATVGTFSRIAYYVELQSGSSAPVKYLWASMNAFTTDAGKIALPTAQSGAFYQIPVASLNIRSNVAGVTTGDGLTGGRLEFWPGDSSPVNTANVSGASSTIFDFGDGGTPGVTGYGSMQLHNRAAGQTLFAFNGWGGAGGFTDLGIGSQGTAQPDWTLSQSSIDYTSRRLQVYVLTAPSSADPFISGQPSSRAVASGSSASFGVTASGSGALTYQWRRNGSAISGATASTYTVSNAQTGNDGTYDVVVSGSGGSVTSDPAILTVLAPGVLANGSFESDYAGWMANGHQLVAQRATDGANGIIFNGGNGSPDGTLLQTVATIPGQTYALSFDVGVNGATNTEQRLNVTVQGGSLLISQTFSVYTASSSAPQWTPTTCTFVADSTTTSIVFNDDSPSTANVDLLLDNVRLSATAAVAPTLANGGFESDFSNWTFSGNLAVVNYGALPPTEGSKLLAFHLLGTIPNASVSQTFPTSPGQVYTVAFDLGVRGFNTNQQRLLVTAQGSGTLLSQLVTINAIGRGDTKWVPTRLTFTADSTSTTLTFQDQSTTSTDISMMLDNVHVTSATGVQTLVVASSPDAAVSITISPADNGGASSGSTQFTRTYNTGTVVTLTAPATSPAGNSFQKWLRNGADFSTSASTNVTLDANYTLTAVYVNATGTPAITAQPASLTAPVGSSASFSVAASGVALSYQWRRNGTAISGATQSSYTLADVQTANAGNYDVVVSNSGGPVTSSIAVLTVITSGVIANGSFESDYDGWTETGNQGIGGSGGSTDGVKAISFNWNDGTPNGVLTQRFVTTPGQSYTLSFDAGVYAFNTKEQRLQVTVQGNTTLVTQTVSIFGISGGNTKWVSRSFTFVPDSNVTTLTFRDVSPTTSGLDLKLDNVAVVTQGTSSAPAITTQPVSLTAPVGSSPSFSVAASGPALSYQWRRNGTAISGATQSSYTLADVQTANAGNYDVVVSNSGGPVTSSIAVLTVITSGVIANGSFESDYDGWTETGNQGIGGSGGSTDGVKAISFNWNDGTPNGVLTQRFVTTPGQSYTLSFDAGVYAFNTKEQRLQVTVQGNTTLVTQTVSIFGISGGNTKWVSRSFTFVPDSNVTTLTFRDVSPTTAGLDLKLDNVAVTTQGTGGALAITLQPASLTAPVGSAASFSVAASGDALSYQWRRDGTPIPGATQSDYTVGSVQTANAGNYDVVVSNSGGSLGSSAAVLTVITSGVIANGSFESGYDGWTQTGNQGIGGSGGSTDGANAISFNWNDSTPSGLLTQRFVTTPGQSYTLSFDAGAYAFNTRTQQLQVIVQGAAQLLSQTISIAGLGGGATRWVSQTYTFAADSATTMLSFLDLSTTTASIDLKLDNVRVTP